MTQPIIFFGRSFTESQILGGKASWEHGSCLCELTWDRYLTNELQFYCEFDKDGCSRVVTGVVCFGSSTLQRCALDLEDQVASLVPAFRSAIAMDTTQRRASRRAHSMCINCGAQYPTPGGSRCEPCREKARARARSRYEDRKKAEEEESRRKVKVYA